MSYNNLEMLTKLSDSEKAKVNEILLEVSKKGKSSQLTDMYYEDYDEIPVDLETFLTSEQYLGNYTNKGKDIYPTWKNELKYVHNPANAIDQWAITGSIGTGKSQPLDSLVFTKNGYIKMRDVKVGTKVINGKGKETIVTDIFPQGKRPTYKMIFSDNSEVLCSDNHLWQVKEYGKGKTMEKVLDTLQIIEGKEKGLKYRIPLPVIDCWEDKNIDLDPYLLGFLLGDGYLKCSSSISVSIYEDDLYDKVNEIITAMGYQLVKSTKPNARDYYITCIKDFGKAPHTNHRSPLLEFIRENDLREKSIEKHIPKHYLYSSIETRTKLLQGLFDTDGYIDSTGNPIYNTSSPQLSEDFTFLVRSLGGTDIVKCKPTYYKKEGIKIKCQDTYEHYIKFNNDFKFYTSEKHKNRFKNKQFGPMRRIKDIQYIGEQEAQCIRVASEDHTYITDNLIVTHNTMCVVFSLCYDLYKIMCLKDPSRFYGLGEDTIYLFFFNLTLKLSERTAYGRFQRALQSSPWFMERGTVSGKKYLEYLPNKNIRFAMGSNLEHALGSACMFAIMDEMSFGKNDDANYQLSKMMEIYNQIHARLGSRFTQGGIVQGRMYLVSSAKATNAVLESFIRDNESQPGMHVSRYKQWEVLPADRWSGKWFKLAVGNDLLPSYIIGENPDPEVVESAERHGYQIMDVPLEKKHDFEVDLNRALIDLAGIALQSAYKYIQYNILSQNFKITNTNPFLKEIIETGMYDSYQIKDFFKPELVPEILYTKKIFIHRRLI